MRTLPISISLTLATLALLATGCSTPPKSDTGNKASSAAPAASTPAPAGTKRIVKSNDGSFEGEIIGTPAPGSRFAKLAIGMSSDEVQQQMTRAPDRFHSYESGKRWIPFYFGNDARRMQALYKGEGCLIFTGGNVWGGGGNDLIQIEVDPSGACYQP